MSGKKVVLVGHCGPDSSYLRSAVASADRGIKVLSADDQQELEAKINEGADLLLFNREMPFGFDQSMGVDLIRAVRERHPDLKMMLVSNFAEAQSAATQAGALAGFGKREIGTPRVASVIRQALGAQEPKTPGS